MLAASLLIALLVIRFAPDSAAGRGLKRGLVDAPADRLSRLSRRSVIAFAALAAAVAVSLFVLRGDSMAFLGMSLPEVTGWFTTFEVSTYLDILVTLGMVGARLRLRGALDAARALIGVARPRPGRATRAAGPSSRRERRSRRPAARKPVNDDEGPRDAIVRRAA